MSTNLCGSCNLEISDSNYIQCEHFCKNKYHKKCACISEASFKILVTDANMMWRCNSCIVSRQIANDLFNKLDKLSAEILELKDQMNFLNKSLNTSPVNNSSKKHSTKSSSKNIKNDTNIPSAQCTQGTFMQSSSNSARDGSEEKTSLSSGINEENATNENKVTLSPEIALDRQKSRPTRKHIIGNSTSTLLEGVSVPKSKWLHLSYLGRNTSADSLTSFIAGVLDISPNLIKCTLLVKKGADTSDFSFINFKAAVPENCIDKIMDASIWPTGVRVREFIQFPKNDERAKPIISS